MTAADSRTASTPVPPRPSEPAQPPRPRRDNEPPPPRGTVPSRKQPAPDSGSALTWAWVAVALIPVFFFVAFAVGEGLTSLLGYPVGGDSPLWVTLLSDLAATIAILLPCVAAVCYANRARKSGERRALIPLVIGALAGTGWLILAIVSEIGDLLHRAA
jgi:hypothetical protein